jgi:hypothetical protein
MNFDGLAGAGIPYLNMMKKAMPKKEPKKKRTGSHRLTEIDPKTKKPRLKKGVSTDRAVEVLFMFENADVTPNQIEDMKQTIENQRQRILKLEDW